MTKLYKKAPMLLLLGSGALMTGALAFQYVGGLNPCVLCIWQRYPHGIVIGLAAIAVGYGVARKPGPVATFVGLSGVALLAGVGIAGFHFGVEQGWWEGLASCAAPSEPIGGGSLENTLKGAVKPPADCRIPGWSLFGLSMTGYNFLFSAALGVFAVVAATHLWRRRA